MTAHEKQFPTQGDLAREQLRRRGFPFFVDVQGEVSRRLTQLPAASCAAFAASCAERGMRWHERLPEQQRRPFTLSWRPVLDAIWNGLASSYEPSMRRVQEALADFHGGPYDHDDGQDGPDDADEDAAAAAIYAAECFAGGDLKSADWAAGRAVDLAFRIANEELQLDPNDFVWDAAGEPMPFAKEAMHPAVQGELRRQLADMELLERHGVTEAVLQRLRIAAA